jgi:hypothetical protein
MNRFPRIRRRPDHFASVHQRARVRAAERLDGPLGLTESAWLDGHLAECAACTSAAAAYEADRLALRQLRSEMPEPPRDLWARTAAAIEREASTRHGGQRERQRAAGRRIPLGALSGVAVVALVVGASLVSQSLFVPQADSLSTGGTEDAAGGAAALGTDGSDETGSITRVQPTPFAVGAGEVQWVRSNQDGTLAYTTADVDEVCPLEAKDGCATLSESAARRLRLDAEPETIIASPDDGTAIMVSRNDAGEQELVVIDLDEEADPTAPPASTPAPTATAAPTAGPTGSPEPATSSPGSPAPSQEPTPEPTGGDTTIPSDDPSSAAPSDSPDATPSGAPTLSPAPSVAASLATDVTVVGHSASFSSDGAWFAFTAQPADGSGGPNVYVWEVGSAEAVQLTVDDRSVFASWADGEVLVSRPVGRDRGRPTAAVNVLIDPVSGSETPAAAAWRPTLDPTRTRAVSWAGAIVQDESGTWRPEVGRLVLGPWSLREGGAEADQTVLFDGDTIGDFDVRWDETGEWVAVWIADDTDPSVGSLDLYRVDPETGALDQPSGAPVDARALAGFSIGDGRLAWATPPGQEGEGSRVQIVAWNADGVGTIETEPGEDVVVIR